MDTGTLYAYIRPGDSNTNRTHVDAACYRKRNTSAADSHPDAPADSDARANHPHPAGNGQNVLHQPDRQR